MWRAKQTVARKQAEIEAAKPKPIGLTPEQIAEIKEKLELPQCIAFVNPAEAAAEVNKALYEKHLTEQAQAKAQIENRESGNTVPAQETGGDNPVA